MARTRKAFVSVINIAMPSPHSAARYVELMRLAYAKKYVIYLRGFNAAMLGSFNPTNRDDNLAPWTGEILRFIDLNANDPWFDLTTKEEADKTSLRQIVIPENLKPHLQRFPFVFYPQGHRLYFLTRESTRVFSPYSVGNFFENLFEKTPFLKYGDINVTVQPTTDSVSQVLGISRLNRLKIELKRPNPDDHQEEERRFLERMERRNVKSEVIELHSPRGSSINPDADLRILANIAAANGSVLGEGYTSADKKIVKSTTSTPLVEQEEYNPNTQSTSNAIESVAARIHRRVTGGRG